MAVRQDGFQTAFPLADVLTLKDVALNGTVKPRADFLAIENVANYVGGLTLPGDLPDASPRMMTMASPQPMNSRDIALVCDSVIAANDDGGDGRMKAIGDGALLKKLLAAALQLLPIILPLL